MTCLCLSLLFLACDVPLISRYVHTTLRHRTCHQVVRCTDEERLVGRHCKNGAKDGLENILRANWRELGVFLHNWVHMLSIVSYELVCASLSICSTCDTSCDSLGTPRDLILKKYSTLNSIQRKKSSTIRGHFEKKHSPHHLCLSNIRHHQGS